jgi:hypothetical protein
LQEVSEEKRAALKAIMGLTEEEASDMANAANTAAAARKARPNTSSLDDDDEDFL